MYVSLPAQHQAERYRQLTAQAQRRQRLAVLQEHHERLQRTPVHSDDEALAKHQALVLLEQARP